MHDPGGRGQLRAPVELEADVRILPTFVGCPAIELIRAAVGSALADVAAEVTVEVSFSEPWSTDRITEAGRRKLAASGFAPPPPAPAGRGLPVLDAVVECPHCGSSRTRLESAFGPTQCRSIRWCAECRQGFEAFKPI